MQPPSAPSTSQITRSGPSGGARKASRRPAITLAIVGLFLIGLGGYGTIRGQGPVSDPATMASPRTQSSNADRTAGAAPRTSASDTHDREPGARRAMARTTDPIDYARAAATALFAWDTGATSRADHLRLLMAEAAPSGAEADALAADTANYLPTELAWDHLADYRTRQWLTIDDAYVPDAWQKATSGVRGDISAGAVAVTIDGIRYRAGVWDDETVTTDHAVGITVFVACPPAFQRCRLLRLSTPGQTLR